MQSAHPRAFAEQRLQTLKNWPPVCLPLNRLKQNYRMNRLVNLRKTEANDDESHPPAPTFQPHQRSEAHDVIPRLRQFILDLAVRGKLVLQDLKDEPSLEALKQLKWRKSDVTSTSNSRLETKNSFDIRITKIKKKLADTAKFAGAK